MRLHRFNGLHQRFGATTKRRIGKNACLGAEEFDFIFLHSVNLNYIVPVFAKISLKFGCTICAIRKMTIKHVEQKEFAPKELFEPNIQIEKYTFNTESFEIEA